MALCDQKEDYVLTFKVYFESCYAFSYDQNWKLTFLSPLAITPLTFAYKKLCFKFCILNKYRCDPYDPPAFRAWAVKGWCTAVPPVLRLFNTLIDKGFKVIILTGRDKETLGQVTVDNLHNQGFIGYERLIMR